MDLTFRSTQYVRKIRPKEEFEELKFEECKILR